MFIGARTHNEVLTNSVTMRDKVSILKALYFSATFALVNRAMPVYAVQGHGGSEGLVSHQVGHILFISGMGLPVIQSDPKPYKRARMV